MGDELSEAQIKHALRSSSGWKIEDASLNKTFRFETFGEAVSFVDAVAVVAERLGHHPDIDLRYNTVTLNLQSHEQGRITEQDLELAKSIESETQ